MSYMAHYMVCRKDAVNHSTSRHNRNTIQSSCFPIIVHLDRNDIENMDTYTPEEFYEYVVRRAFNSISQGYTGQHDYIVIPMRSAVNVSFKPRPVYDVSVSDYD